MQRLTDGSTADASTPDRSARISARDRHTNAVASSVAQAHQAADDGDFVQALSWVSVLQAIGELPSELERLKASWFRSSLAEGATEGARS